MITLFLAAASALVWGTADFAGGKASRHAPALTVSVLSKVGSLAMLGLYLILLRGTPDAGSLAWGAAAGVVGMVGLIVFYRALSAGAMTVVAPVSAVTTALVPLGIGLLIERVPGPVALAGVACALAAIAMVSAAPGVGRSVVTPRLLGLAVAAGTAFGLFFALLDRSSAESGLWPIAAAQLSAILFGGALLLRQRTVPRLSGPPLRLAIGAGVLDMSANALYLLAAQQGLLSIVAPIAALYPVSTVLLARIVDREPVRPVQFAGLGLAATALILVAS